MEKGDENMRFGSEKKFCLTFIRNLYMVIHVFLVQYI